MEAKYVIFLFWTKYLALTLSDNSTATQKVKPLSVENMSVTALCKSHLCLMYLEMQQNNSVSPCPASTPQALEEQQLTTPVRNMIFGKLFNLSFTLGSTSVIWNDINSSYIIDSLGKDRICEKVKNGTGSWQPGCDVPSRT